ncbi:hypothetical protein [Kitasatospora aburaviensis]|uniref:Uncharacterized protein n=1 Tax=Kitasatospora aburaviensis TaxID=67265 RepID=A0ABW1F201_9ACTN
MGTALTFPLLASIAVPLPDEPVATCFETGCPTEIDLGPASRCGTASDGIPDEGCGQHFCPEHLWLEDVLTPQAQHCEA